MIWDASVHAWGDGSVGARFTYASHDGEEGYPGAVKVTAEYRLTSANELVMEFTATPDKPTPINLCNHIYWNLSGELRSKILDHEIQINAPYFVEIDGDAVRVHSATWDVNAWRVSVSHRLRIAQARHAFPTLYC